jgi:hypothetical protein
MRSVGREFTRQPHRHLLPLQRGLASELALLLLSGGVGVEGKDQLAGLAHPVPTPAVHAEDRYDAGHACSEQRPRIESALAHLQWPGTSLQRRDVEVAFAPGRWSWRLAFGTCSAVPTVGPYRFTR